MRVLVKDIKAKISSLPPNVRDLVTIDPKDASLAYVKSFTTDEVFIVHIEPHKDDPGDKSILNSTCPCPARALCHHVTAFYAVSKGLLPVEGFLPKTGQEDAKPAEDVLRRLTMEAIGATAAWFEEMERRMRRHDER